MAMWIGGYHSCSQCESRHGPGGGEVGSCALPLLARVLEGGVLRHLVKSSCVCVLLRLDWTGLDEVDAVSNRFVGTDTGKDGVFDIYICVEISIMDEPIIDTYL